MKNKQKTESVVDLLFQISSKFNELALLIHDKEFIAKMKQNQRERTFRRSKSQKQDSVM